MEPISISESPRRKDTKLGSAKASEVLSNIAILLTTVAVFLLPVFVIPDSFLALGHVKGLLIFFTFTLTLFFWVLSRIRRKEIIVPRSLAYLFFFLVPLVYLISALFTPSFNRAFFGSGFEAGTFLTIATLFLWGALIPLIFQKRLSSLRLFGAFYLGFLVLALVHIIRLIGGPDILSFGVLSNVTSSPIGSWNDLSLFSGLISLISLIALEVMRTARPLKIFLWISLVVSLAFVALVNFVLTWVLLAVFSALTLIYVLLTRKREKIKGGLKTAKRLTPVLSVVLLLLSILFVVVGAPVGDFISDTFGISHVQVRPSWTSTIDVAQSTLSEARVESALLGSGPNRFTPQWFKYKPVSINTTPFWGVGFGFGVGFIPTQLVTTGLLGLFIWLSFLALLIILGLKVVRYSFGQDPVFRFVGTSLFFSTLFLWTSAVFFSPSITLLAFAVICSGALIAKAHRASVIGDLSHIFRHNPRGTRITTSLLLLFMIMVVLGGIVVVERVFAYQKLNNAIVLAESGLFTEAQSELDRAQELFESDIFSRAQVRLDLLQMNALFAQESDVTEAQIAEFQRLLEVAIEHGRRAIAHDDQNPENWFALGEVYSTIIPAGVEGAPGHALTNLERAMELDPLNPYLNIEVARVHLMSEDNAAARLEIVEAIQKKINYVPAYQFLAQIELNEGNMENAATLLEEARRYAPQNVSTLFALGVVRYNLEEYEQAVRILEQTVQLVPTYSNARYFLGLSYVELGREESARAQFNNIRQLNPGDAEVERILQSVFLDEEGSVEGDEADDVEEGDEADESATTTDENNEGGDETSIDA